MIPDHCPHCGSAEVRIVTRAERPHRYGPDVEAEPGDGWGPHHALTECAQPECGRWLSWVAQSELLEEGKLMESMEDQIKALKEALNASVVRKTPDGYSHLEGFYVITELNRIFGHDRWSYDVLELATKDFTRQAKKGDLTCTVARATVRLEVTFANGTTRRRTDVGAGSGFAYSGDLGVTWRGAVTEAVTHALKRCSRTFGNPFGLSLYDKGNPLHQGGEDVWAGDGPVQRTAEDEPTPERPWTVKVAQACDHVYRLAPHAEPDIDQVLASHGGAPKGGKPNPNNVPEAQADACLQALRDLYGRIKQSAA